MNSASPTRPCKQAVVVPLLRLVPDPSDLDGDPPDSLSFKVPAQDYSTGNITGIQLAWRLMDQCRKQPGDVALMAILAEAMAIKTASDGGTEELSQRGAAIGFIGAIEILLEQVAAEFDFERVFRSGIEACERSMLKDLRDLRAKNQQFARRMSVKATTNP